MPRKKTPKPETLTLHLDLFAPGMTPVMRTGLAGLYMTLERVEVKGFDVKLTPRSVSLSWKRTRTKACFTALFESAFKIDGKGVMDFPGHHNMAGEAPPIYNRLLHQESLCQTLIQHGSVRTYRGEKETIVVHTGALPEQSIIRTYYPLKDFAHQKGADVCSDELLRTKPKDVKVVSWLYPGATEKIPGKAFTRMEVSIEQLLCLYFLPVGLLAWRVSGSSLHWGNQAKQRMSMGGGMRGVATHERSTLVLPSIQNLATFASWRREMMHLPVTQSLASCAEDAFYRTAISLDEESAALPIEVMAYGVQPWSKQQKTRLFVRQKTASSEEIGLVRRALESIPALWVQARRGDLHTSHVLESMTRAMFCGRPWYEGVVTMSQYNLTPFKYAGSRHALHALIHLYGEVSEREASRHSSCSSDSLALTSTS